VAIAVNRLAQFDPLSGGLCFGMEYDPVFGVIGISKRESTVVSVAQIYVAKEVPLEAAAAAA
jgi:hypothetical protein